MKLVKVAIIGGTGVYANAFLEEAQEMIVETDYGRALFCRGYYKGREIYFLARHGTGHAVPPHRVNYRANIAALKKLHIDAVISTAAVGSMRQEMPPGSRVVLDQFIDFTKSRPSTFYDGDSEVVHTDLSVPYCPEIRRAIFRAGRALGERLIDGGCYLCTEGPRFETPAEIKMFAGWGGDLVGMTNVPEVVLAREAGLCYATIALVSNFAAGISVAPLSHQEVLEEMARGKDSLDRLLVEAAIEIAAVRSCGCSLSAGPWPPEREAECDEPEPLRTLYWEQGRLFLLDQRLLPGKVRYLECCTVTDVVEAIKEMAVRGAPAIGISAAFGMVLAAQALGPAEPGPAMRQRLAEAAEILRSTRPTAVNLHWALRRMERCLDGAAKASSGEIIAMLEEEAQTILAEDITANRRIGAHGEPLIPKKASILTHCNAGALATGGYGTALGVVRAAAAAGKQPHLYVDETRPLLQGARLTALELLYEKIPATLVTDNCAGYLMASGKVDLVITGADRIAANGDTANKIGTYTLAVLAQRHGIPFYIAAPCSTIDLSLSDGGGIVIEERDPAEVTMLNGQKIAPAGIDALNPAFDITPAELISALITERGVLHRPDQVGLANLMAKGEG